MKDLVQGLWVGKALSTMEWLSISSFIAHGHEYHLYVYDEISDLPAGLMLKDANEILPKSMIFQYRDSNSYAGFANYFRYKLLLERGGWWVDLDVVCTKAFEFDTDYVFSSESNRMGRETINSGIIRTPRDAEVMKYAWEVCCSKDPTKIQWGETGPALMKESVHRLSLERFVRSYRTFCPINPDQWLDILLPGRPWNLSDETYAVHLWHECWRRMALDKDEVYAPRCLYEHLKNLYLPK